MSVIAESEVLLRRYPENPILTAAQWPYRAASVFNPDAVRLPDGTTLLLCLVEDRRGHSHLTVPRSADGVTDWQIDAAPTFEPDLENHPYEYWGIEDPRITRIDEIDKYVIAYTSYSRDTPCVSPATTTDFKEFARLGVIFQPEDKNAVVFPKRINGQFLILHRPVTPKGAHIWISQSPDLVDWGHPVFDENIMDYFIEIVSVYGHLLIARDEIRKWQVEVPRTCPHATPETMTRRRDAVIEPES